MIFKFFKFFNISPGCQIEIGVFKNTLKKDKCKAHVALSTEEPRIILFARPQNQIKNADNNYVTASLFTFPLR
jgi:hypothetical protein